MPAFQPIDDRRRAVFLKVLSETGSMVAAAAAASPHLDQNRTHARPGYESFRDLIRRDPEFSERVQEAKTSALGRVEEEISRRAFTPDERPIFGKDGALLGVQTDHRNANGMLLRLAERLDPTWAPRKHHEVQGKVAHEHVHDHRYVFELRSEHVLLLEEEDRSLLLDLLDKIHLRLTNDDERRQLPAPPPAGDARSQGADNN